MTRFLAFLTLLLSASPAFAEKAGIIAVVNDEAISTSDLDARMRIVIASSNMGDSQEIRQRLAPQVLRSLVDEKLELQEARRLNIKIPEQEVGEALSRIEEQNHLPKGGLNDFLKARGIDPAALTEQTTAGIAWAKVVRQRSFEVSPVSDEEVDGAVARYQESAAQPQLRLAEIFLAVDNPVQEEEIRRSADKLFEQLHEGAAFSALARQFSKSPTAAVGGDMGWVLPSELPAEIGRTVRDMKPGQLAPPLRVGGGYYILYLIDRRAPGGGQATELSLAQIMFPLSPGAPEKERQNRIAEATRIQKEAKSCGEFLKIGREVAPQTSGDLGRVRLDDLPAELRQVVAPLSPAEISPPVPLRGGIGLLMVCARHSEEGGAPNREQVMDTLARERMDSFAQRYLRDLRRTAFVDIRG